MENFLSMENILTGEEAANLFADDSEETKVETPPKQETAQEETTEEEENKEKEETTEVNPEELFAEEEPESVGSEEINKEGKKDTTSSEEDGSSPKTNFYSSIASALKEEGIFPDLDDSTIEKVVEAEDFRDLVERQIQAGLEEAQKRVFDALNNGVEPSVIKQYE
jgi:hypothetical protein